MAMVNETGSASGCGARFGLSAGAEPAVPGTVSGGAELAATDAGASAVRVSRPSVATTLTRRPNRVFIPGMAARRFGRVVNVSSGAGQLAGMSTYAPAYSMSKAALNALTRILAATYRKTGVLVNAVDPGWVRTDMGGRSAPRSVEQGADTIVWLATLPDDGPSGGFFRDRRPIDW